MRKANSGTTSVTNMIRNSEPNAARDLQTAVDARGGLSRQDQSAGMNATLRILADSVCSFEQRVSELVEEFSDRLTFIDFARTPEFTGTNSKE
jgi:hypothetical protein